LEERVEDLSGQVKVLQAKLKKKSEEVVRKLSSKTMETLARIRNFLKHPGDIVNKAKFFGWCSQGRDAIRVQNYFCAS